MAKPELGTKRQCQSCGGKFFDLNRDPIICPKCGTVFQAAGRAPVSTPDDDEDEVPDPATPEVVSLEDADADATKDVPDVPGDDIEIEDDGDSNDDTFLEDDEEENDDVSGLIDGDLDDDEES